MRLSWLRGGTGKSVPRQIHGNHRDREREEGEEEEEERHANKFQYGDIMEYQIS